MSEAKKPKQPSEIVKRYRGRPTKYTPEMCDKLIEYFGAPMREKRIVQQATASGKIVEIEVEEFRDPPIVEGFCAELMISKQTFYDWIKAHKEFLDAFNTAKQLQANVLIAGSMGSKYNASISKLILANCTDYKESKEVEHTGEVKLNYSNKPKEE